uniref:Uncharacterized protein n=1 Tax=Acrobeloides nanus TaxID=290746 RepID=A0A914CY28_9BILA
MMAHFPYIPTTSSTMPTQVLPMFPIPAVTQQQLHPQQHQLPPFYNFIPHQQQVSLQTATSVVFQSPSANDHQQQTVTTSAFPQNAQLLQIMQQHILQDQQQQQQQQQRMIFAQAHQQKPLQQVIQAPQVPQQADQGQLVLQDQVSAQHANGGLSLGSTNQRPTLVTPAMLASMGINMAQVATLTPNGLQIIPGSMINLSQFQTIALAPTTQQTSSNTPIFLSSIAIQQPTQIQPPQPAQSTMTQLNHYQPMQLAVPSMALIEQMQQQRLLQQQAAVAAAASTTASTVPTSTPLPVLQPQAQQPQQVLGGVYMPKSQVSISQLDQNQLAQMLMSSQAQVQTNSTLVSMQAQANSGNNASKMQFNQYMNHLQNLEILSQQGHPIMK